MLTCNQETPNDGTCLSWA